MTRELSKSNAFREPLISHMKNVRGSLLKEITSQRDVLVLGTTEPARTSNQVCIRYRYLSAKKRMIFHNFQLQT